MNKLTEKAFENSLNGVFTLSDVLIWLGESKNSVRNIVKRAIASGEILHLRRGLYCLSSKYQRTGLSRNMLANLIYGPSYVSMETALAYYGWIPEAVHSVSSVSLNRAKEVETPVGYFDYVQVKQTTLLKGVRREVSTENPAVSFLIASPLKAIADYVASHHVDWLGVEPLEDSLRIDTDELESLTSGDFKELEGLYVSKRARNFLAGLRKELQK